MKVRSGITRLAALVLAAGTGLAFDCPPEEEPVFPEWRTVGEVRDRWIVHVIAGLQVLTAEAIATPNRLLFSIGTVRSLDPVTGTEYWKQGNGFKQDGAELAYHDGLVVAAVRTGAFAMDAGTGAIRWTYTTPPDDRATALNGTPGAPGYPANGYITMDQDVAYLPAWGGTVSAIELQTGRARWIWQDSTLFPNPAGATGTGVSGDTVYVHAWYARERGRTTADDYLFALDRKTGGTLWKALLPEPVTGSGVGRPIAWRNLVMVQQERRLIAYDRFTAAPAWTFQEPGNAVALAHFAVDGDQVYLGNRTNTGMNEEVLALDAATGAVRWRTVVYMGPQKGIVASARRVYATEGAFLSVLDKTTGQLIVRVKAPKEGYIHRPVVLNGAVFVQVGQAAPGGIAYWDDVWSFDEP